MAKKVPGNQKTKGGKKTDVRGNSHESCTSCPTKHIILSDREKVNADKLIFPWRKNNKGYFLLKIEDGKVCCGFVNWKHHMLIEWQGTDSDKIMKDIAQRKLCSDHFAMAYIASELMRAEYHLKNNIIYVQR